jgi:hypothetical protein
MVTDQQRNWSLKTVGNSQELDAILEKKIKTEKYCRILISVETKLMY